MFPMPHPPCGIMKVIRGHMVPVPNPLVVTALQKMLDGYKLTSDC